MGEPSRQLARESIGDVDVQGGARAGEEPDLADGVWREALSLVLRETQGIAGEGIDGIERRAADRPMVATGKIGWIGVLGVMGEEHRGAPATDPLNQLGSQVSRRLDIAIGMTQERDFRQAEATGGFPGFVFPPPRHLRWPCPRVVGAVIPRGDEQQASRCPAIDGKGQRASTPTSMSSG